MKKKKGITNEEFFERLVIRSNGLPKDVVKDVYYSILKVMMDELRDGKEIELPNFGNVRLIEIVGHRRKNVNTGEYMDTSFRKIGFSFHKNLKSYVNNMTIRKPQEDDQPS